MSNTENLKVRKPQPGKEGLSGILFRTLFKTNPPLPKVPSPVLSFSAESIQQKTILIAGATSGLGFQACLQFVQYNPRKIILAVRNEKSGEETKEACLAQKDLPKGFDSDRIEIRKVDFSDIELVKSFTEELEQDYAGRSGEGINIVVLGAGRLNPGNKRKANEKGEELELMVNYVATSYAAIKLLPVLRRGYETTQEPSRLTTVSSFATFMNRTLRFSKDPEANIIERYNSVEGYQADGRQYAAAKLMLIFFTRELGEHIDKSSPGQIIVNTFEPGLAATPMTANSPGKVPQIIKTLSQPTDVGARSYLWAVLSKEGERQGGFMSGCRDT